MRSRFLTIVLAAVLAVFGTVAVLAYVHQANERAVNGLKAETVFQASGPIPAGTSLLEAQQEKLLTSQKLPVSSLSSTPVGSVFPAIEHLVMSANVAKGQFLLLNMLVPATSVAAVGTLPVPPGMVAVTMLMCIQEAIANYVTVGSNVAVFDTYVAGAKTSVQRSCATDHGVIPWGDSGPNGALVGTRLVLTSAEVLAVGENSGTQGPAAGSTSTLADPPLSSASSTQDSVLVTLAVKEPAAEKLILIEELGLPYMVLLGPKAVMGFGNNMNNLFGP